MQATTSSRHASEALIIQAGSEEGVRGSGTATARKGGGGRCGGFGQTDGVDADSGGGDQATARLLLEWGAAVNAQDPGGWTPLMRAAEKGHEAVVELLLLEWRAAVEVTDEDGCTPLMWAAENGHEAVARAAAREGRHRSDAAVVGSRERARGDSEDVACEGRRRPELHLARLSSNDP